MNYDERTSAVEEQIHKGLYEHMKYHNEQPKVLILSEYAYRMLLMSPSVRYSVEGGFMGDIAVYEGMTIVRIINHAYVPEIIVMFGQGSENHILQGR